MASHLMHMNVIFKENIRLTDAYYYKHSKMTIFYHALTQERNNRYFLVECNLEGDRNKHFGKN